MDKGTALSYKKKTCYDSIYITGMSLRSSNPGGQAVVRWAQSAPPVGIGLSETPNPVGFKPTQPTS